MRRLALIALLGLVALSGCGGSKASPTGGHAQLPCPAKPSGDLCIRVVAHHLELDDAIGYLVSSGSTPASGTWRLVLTSYPCDPGYDARPRCGASDVFPGPVRHGLPPAATSCRVPSTGAVTTAPPGCHDTLAQAMATHGDWNGMDLLSQGKPMTFPHPVWLCVSEQVLAGTWQQPPAADAPARPRACAALSAA